MFQIRFVNAHLWHHRVTPPPPRPPPPILSLRGWTCLGRWEGGEKGEENDNDEGDSDAAAADDNVYYGNDGVLKAMMTMITIIIKLTAVMDSRRTKTQIRMATTMMMMVMTMISIIMLMAVTNNKRKKT